MRDPRLHAALREFVREAADRLGADAADGSDLSFDLVEVAPGRPGRPALAAYRPVVEPFIRTRLGAIGRLPSYAPAARAVEGLDGLERYLRRRGERRIPPPGRELADATLRSFLTAVLEDADGFRVSDGRFDTTYAELEASVYQGRVRSTVLAELTGLVLESERIELGQGLVLAAAETLEERPPAGAITGTVLALDTLHKGSAEPAVPAARLRFRRLVTALRLLEPGGFALAATGWSRIDDGPWRPVTLGGNGRGHGAPARLTAAAEDELRAFTSLVGRRLPSTGPVAWALGRYEMGRERPTFEGMTDHRLALEALLDPAGEGPDVLARRVAAICAPAGERADVGDRVLAALRLERDVVAGVAAPVAGGAALADELGDHARAILRDLVVGHLESDLVGLADRLLEPA